MEKEGVNDGVGQEDIPAEQVEMDLDLFSRESRKTQLKGSAGSIKEAGSELMLHSLALGRDHSARQLVVFWRRVP